ncbi:hypothetical protein CJ010_10375 [Azoarcus sp. DD4]|uniref:DUF3742 family protein n=1 Tax=Azoarcus sp. DD4 TaxID=2027405 RepID=UPI0011281AAA|nr:DUF3742 family protein [Azoarcus sp. DD4]QDF96905.1 hypothetical protein CJ010_10375 [Azoarcus sp. DD4]
MKPAVYTTFAEHAGRTLGRMWRGLVRLDRKAHGRLMAVGWTPGRAGAALLALKFVLLGVLAYTALWLALLLALVAFAAWTARNSERDDSEEWAIGDQAERKRSIFYDPINYDDDPDPRFDDER